MRRARENNSQGKLSHKREDNSPALATKPCGPHPCLHAAFPRLVQLPALECNANSKLAGEWVQKEGPEKKKKKKVRVPQYRQGSTNRASPTNPRPRSLYACSFLHAVNETNEPL